MEDLRYKIGISLISKIGDINAKKLIAWSGGAEAVFKEKKQHLLKIPGIGLGIAEEILNQNVLKRADEEIEFINKHKIQTLFYLDEDYPRRLKNCVDSPVMLYFKGNCNLNPSRSIALVGTRRATDYGRSVCEKLVEDLKKFDVTIISGLAHGIDITAHRACLNQNIPTIAAVGHGLDRIYPSTHTNTAQQMTLNGGIITEFIHKTVPDAFNFPRRNRVIAGMTDATVVVEAAESGGALITADIANSYNRDVFAIPGRSGDTYSKGCNALIKHHKAALAESATDIAWLLGWTDDSKSEKPIQQQLFVELSEEEKLIADAIADKTPTNIDIICYKTNISMSKVSALLLNMEFSGIIRSLPGKMYQLL